MSSRARTLAALCTLACVASTALADELLISGTPLYSVSPGQQYDFQPQATAVGALAPYFEVQNLPPWATFTAYNGHLSGVPTAADAGVYLGIQISLTDGQSVSTLPPFSISVQGADGSQSTVLTWTPSTQNVDGTPLTDLLGYYVYEGESPDSLVLVGFTLSGSPTSVFNQLAPGIHYFAVSALNLEYVESALSPIVAATIDPLAAAAAPPL
jgi:hypothetical protein